MSRKFNAPASGDAAGKPSFDISIGELGSK
jgi:hypothetical protein